MSQQELIVTHCDNNWCDKSDNSPNNTENSHPPNWKKFRITGIKTNSRMFDACSEACAIAIFRDWVRGTYKND